MVRIEKEELFHGEIRTSGAMAVYTESNLRIGSAAIDSRSLDSTHGKFRAHHAFVRSSDF